GGGLPGDLLDGLLDPLLCALLDPLHGSADATHELLVRLGLRLELLSRRGRSRVIPLRLGDQTLRGGAQPLPVETLRELAERALDALDLLRRARGGLRGRCPVDPLRQLLVHDLLMPGELLHGLRQCRELLLDGGVLRGQRLQHLRTALLLVGGPGLVHQSHDPAPSSSGCARTSLAPGPARTPARVSSPRAAARPASPRLGRLRCRESSAPYPRSCPSSPSSSAAASVAPG